MATSADPEAFSVVGFSWGDASVLATQINETVISQTAGYPRLNEMIGSGFSTVQVVELAAQMEGGAGDVTRLIGAGFSAAQAVAVAAAIDAAAAE